MELKKVEKRLVQAEHNRMHFSAINLFIWEQVRNLVLPFCLITEQRINVCKYIPFFLISSLNVRQQLALRSFAIPTELSVVMVSTLIT